MKDEVYRASDGLLKSQLDSPIESPVASLRRAVELQDLGLKTKHKVAGRGGAVASVTVPKVSHRYRWNLGSPIDSAQTLLQDHEYYRASTTGNIVGNITFPDGSLKQAMQKIDYCTLSFWLQRNVSYLIKLEKSRYNDYVRRYLPQHYRKWLADQDARYKRWRERRKRLLRQAELEYAAYHDLDKAKARRALQRLKRIQSWTFRAYNYVSPKYRPKYVDLARQTACVPTGVKIGLPKTWFLPCNHMRAYTAYAYTEFELLVDRIATRNLGEETYERTNAKFAHMLLFNGAYARGAQVHSVKTENITDGIPLEDERIDSYRYSWTRAQLDQYVAGHLPQTVEKLSLFEIVSDVRDALKSLWEFYRHFDRAALRIAQAGTNRRVLQSKDLKDWHPLAHNIAMMFRRDGISYAEACRRLHIPFPNANGGPGLTVRRIYQATKGPAEVFTIARSSAAAAVDSYQFYRFAILSGMRDGITVGNMMFSRSMGDYGRYIERIFNTLGSTQSYHVMLRDRQTTKLIKAERFIFGANRFRTADGGMSETTSIPATDAPLDSELVQELTAKVTPVWRLRKRDVERATVIADASLVNLLGLDVDPYSMLTQMYLMFHYMGLSVSGVWQCIRYTYIIDKLIPAIREFLENPRYSAIGLEYRVHSYGISRKETYHVSFVDHGSSFHDHESYVDELGFHNDVSRDAHSRVLKSNIPSGKEVLVASRFRRSRLKPTANVWPQQSPGKPCTPEWGKFLMESSLALLQKIL